MLDSEAGASAPAVVRAAPIAQGTPTDGDAATASFAHGAFVGGRYRIVRFIARGGMGEVFEAFDEELRVRVALKVATRTHGRALDRFKREVTLARRVTHRNVCRLFEIGFEPVGADATPYCTMELLEGTTLSARLERGPLPIGDARAIIEQIAAGLQAAHDVGVIHRDFKSSNILLVPDGDGRERAVITDFGLARAESSVAGDGSVLTAEQALIGTPAYMAPEQVECKPPTAAADIYALGVVMFEMVTGELPFRADTPMATAVLRLTQPPPPVRAKRPALGASWESAIGRCLAIDPAKRLARAADVTTALDEAVPPRRTARWAIAGGAVAAAAIAVVAGVSLHSTEAPRAATALPPAPANAPRTILIADPVADPPADGWIATAAAEALRAELRVPALVKPLDGDLTAQLTHELLEARDPATKHAALVRLAAATPAQLLVAGTLHDDTLVVRVIDLASGSEVPAGGEVVHAGDVAGAMAKLGGRLRTLLAGDNVVLDADHAAKVLPATPDAARAYAEGLARARAHDHQGAIASLTRTTELAPGFGLAYLALYGELRAVRQGAKAAQAAQRAFELAGGLRTDQRLHAEAIYRESRKEWPLASNLWSTLAAADPDNIAVASALARSLSADHQLERCFDVLDRLRRRPAPVGDDPRIDLQEALCAREAGDFRRGLSAATRADVKAGVRGARDAQATALALEGEMLANAGEYDRAIVVLDRAKQLDEARGDSEGVLEAMRQIGFVLGEQGKLDGAFRTYREATALARKIDDRLAEGIVLNDWGQLLPKAQDALEMFQRGLVIAREQDDERLITALSLNLANKQDATGKPEDAIATYHDVIARAKTQQDDENLATAEMNLGDTLVKVGRRAEALPLISDALASYQRRGDENGVGYALISRGDVHWELGDLQAARSDYEASLAQRTKLGEQRNIAQSQERLARFDLAEDRANDAEPLVRAALAQRRSEADDDEIAQTLVTLAYVQVALGHGADALASLAEAEQRSRPDPGDHTGAISAIEVAFVRGLADPAHAGPQVAIIRGNANRAGCPDCPAEAALEEGQIEQAAGHTARARTLLADARRRAQATHAGDLAARAARLLAR